MNQRTCLSDQEITLLYYGEFEQQEAQPRHLSGCASCAKRLETLEKELADLPVLDAISDSLSGTRMAARVEEQLQNRRKRRFPLLGTSAAAALILLVTFISWPPEEATEPPLQVTLQSTPGLELNEDMPDIDFLEDLELIRDLEFLAQIEGV